MTLCFMTRLSCQPQVSVGDSYTTPVEHIANIEDAAAIDNNRQHHGLYSDVGKDRFKQVANKFRRQSE